MPNADASHEHTRLRTKCFRHMSAMLCSPKAISPRERAWRHTGTHDTANRRTPSQIGASNTRVGPSHSANVSIHNKVNRKINAPQNRTAHIQDCSLLFLQYFAVEFGLNWPSWPFPFPAVHTSVM